MSKINEQLEKNKNLVKELATQLEQYKFKAKAFENVASALKNISAQLEKVERKIVPLQQVQLRTTTNLILVMLLIIMALQVYVIRKMF